MKHIYFGLLNKQGVASESPYLLLPRDEALDSVGFETYGEASAYRARKISDSKKQGGDDGDAQYVWGDVYCLLDGRWHKIERFVKSA